MHNYAYNQPQVFIFFPMVQQLPVGQRFLTVEDSCSQSDTPHSVGLHWTSDHPDTVTST